jgi:serine/threonine protein kinase
MAEVWLASDVQSGERCALKRLLVDKVDLRRDARSTLFEAEYHTLAQLRHPHIVRVDDYGVEAGQAFYTMELLEGGDLVVQDSLDWRKLAGVVCDIASALALIHSRRFVHRDVTPRNVHFDDKGELRLIDFGALAPMGMCREVVGTPPFVPPEALNSQPLDSRSDLFSLGALAYWALTRRHAYPARTLRELRDCWRSRRRRSRCSRATCRRRSQRSSCRCCRSTRRCGRQRRAKWSTACARSPSFPSATISRSAERS